MKKIILSICLVMVCTVGVIGKPQQQPEIKQDTTSFIKKSLNNASKSLDNRDFSKDVKNIGNKADSLVKEYAPAVKGFVNSLGEYFKR